MEHCVCKGLLVAVVAVLVVGCSHPAARPPDAPLLVASAHTDQKGGLLIIGADGQFVSYVGNEHLQTLVPQGRLSIPTVHTETVQTRLVNPMADALYELGRKHMEGDGIERNEAQALAYLEESKALGSAEAKRVLAVLALRRDPFDQAAREALQEAAKVDVKAQAHYGMMLANVTDPKLNNPDLGLQYLESAREAGSHEASFGLHILNKGKDPAASQKYLLEAAERGNKYALQSLARVKSYSALNAYDLGLLSQAVLAHQPQAMFDYANLLMIQKIKPSLINGKPSRDFEAYHWFRQASQKGHKEASVEVENLRGLKAGYEQSGLTNEAFEAPLKSGLSKH